MTYIYRSIYRPLVIRCLVVKIEYLQVTVDVVTQTTALNNRVNLLSKFAYTNLYTKGPFSSGGFSRETQN